MTFYTVGFCLCSSMSLPMPWRRQYILGMALQALLSASRTDPDVMPSNTGHRVRRGCGRRLVMLQRDTLQPKHLTRLMCLLASSPPTVLPVDVQMQAKTPAHDMHVQKCTLRKCTCTHSVSADHFDVHYSLIFLLSELRMYCAVTRSQTHILHC